MSYGTIYGPEKFFLSEHRSLKFLIFFYFRPVKQVTASFDPIDVALNLFRLGRTVALQKNFC